MKRVVVIDTSILCVWLEVPGKATCGSDRDRWDKVRVDRLIRTEETAGSTLVLPLATIIETGNHIAQAAWLRYATAQKLAALMTGAANKATPWAAFTDQASLWDRHGLLRLAAEWPELAAGKLSIGDASIKTVAEHYARMGYEVKILTADTQLQQFEPQGPQRIPRREKK
jgi:hypothetical protein